MATTMERDDSRRMAMTSSDRASDIERAGEIVLRYGLVVALLWVGGLKFTAYEAESVHGLAAHSPFLSWLTQLMSVQAFSEIIGVVEIVLGLLIAARFVSPKASAIGSFGAVLIFLNTISFLFTTPGVVQMGETFPLLSGMPGQFLLKDFVLLGAALWSAGEALRAATRPARSAI